MRRRAKAEGNRVSDVEIRDGAPAAFDLLGLRYYVADGVGEVSQAPADGDRCRRTCSHLVILSAPQRSRNSRDSLLNPWWYSSGMAIRTELTLRLQNSPGALAQLCQALADEKVNVLAMNLESSGVLHLVPDNPVHACRPAARPRTTRSRSGTCCISSFRMGRAPSGLPPGC